MKRAITSPSEPLPTEIIEIDKRLAQASEADDLFAYEINLKNNVITWSQNAALVIDCAPEALSAVPAERDFFINKTDKPKVSEVYESALANGAESFETTFRGREGDLKRAFWRVRGTVVRNEQGFPIRVIAVHQNITFEKNTEAELRLVAERLSTAEEAAGTQIYDWNLKTGVVWRSAGIELILGWTALEMGSTMAKWAELLHPDDAPRLKGMALGDFSSLKDRFLVEYRLRHKRGHYVWLLDSGRVYRNAQGEVTRVAGARVDISSRKHAEAASNRQAAMINLSFEPIFAWHPERGIVEWNHGAEQLYGYSRDEALGLPSDSLLHTVRPIGNEKLMEILKVENSYQVELQRRAKDGRQITIECRHQLIEMEGDVLILETDHDISEKKRADAYTAQLAAVVLASHDAIFGITLEGHIETWNPAAQRIFDYTAEEAIGQHVKILALPPEYEEQSQIMHRAQNSVTVGPYEARRMKKDGSAVYVSVAIAPVRAADGSLLSLSVAIQDISQRKEWEARQRLMNRELAHRNKNSFAVLQGIMRSTLRDAKSPEAFAEAFSGRLHSLAAAQDILTASDWRGAELRALLRHQLKAYASPDDNRLVVVGPELNLPPQYAVPFSLVFNELATNAIKYGALSVPSGNVHIYWRTERPTPETIKLYLIWRERGGPPPVKPQKTGFGMTLIEKNIPDAKIEIDWETQGLTCKLELVLQMAKKPRASYKRSIGSGKPS